MSKSLIIFISILLLGGCSASNKSPSEVYEEYNKKEISGRTFEEEKSFFTKRKQQEVDAKIPQYMKQMKKSKAEVIEFYLGVTQRMAKCKEVILVEQKIENINAILTYSLKDICDDKIDTQKQIVSMTNENGWKIDDIEITL